MNKKGQTMPLAILSAIAIFIVGLMFVNFIMPEVTNFRTGMDCVNAESIRDGAKILCLIGDAVVPYFIIVIVSLAVGVIIARLRLWNINS